MEFVRLIEALNNEVGVQMSEVVQMELLARTGQGFLSNKVPSEVLDANQERSRSLGAAGETILNSIDVWQSFMRLMENREYHAIVNKNDLRLV